MNGPMTPDENMLPEKTDIENVIEQLESLKQDNLVTLISSDGCSLQVAKKDLSCCAYFNKHLTNNITLMNVPGPGHALRNYLRYLEGKPVSIDNVFHSIQLGIKIKCKRFIEYCAHSAKGIEIPAKASDDAREVLFQLLKYLPVRTHQHYKDLLRGLENVPDYNSLIDAVISALLPANGHGNVYMNSPLDVPVFENRVSVALMDDIQGNRITAIFRGDRWTSSDIFAGFCPFEAHVRHFHLCFGQYVVYQTLDGSVMMKSLGNEDPPTMLFHSSKFFRSRRNELHMIRQNDTTGVDTLYRWDHKSKQFVELFLSPSWRLASAHTNSGGQTIVVLSDGSVVEFSDADCMLARTRDNERVTDYIDGWSKYDDGYVQCLRIDGEDSKVRLNEPAHMGYNLLGVEMVRDGAYRTVSYECEPNGHFTRKCTTLHGQIRTITDVVLL